MEAPDKLDMETRILDAAKRVFVLKGYDQTTMSDVAAEIGIGRTALHYYFRTKEMLFDAILSQLISLLLPNIKRIAEGEGTMLEKLPLIIEAYAKVLQNNLSFPAFIVMEMNRAPERLFQVVLKNQYMLQPVLQIKTQIEEEMNKGLLRSVPLIDVVTTIIGLMVFPILLRNPMTAIFMNGADEEQYRKYIAGRTPFVTDMVRRMLDPDYDFKKNNQ